MNFENLLEIYHVIFSDNGLHSESSFSFMERGCPHRYAIESSSTIEKWNGKCIDSEKNTSMSVIFSPKRETVIVSFSLNSRFPFDSGCLVRRIH